MPDDQKLAAELKRAKSASPSSPSHFAMLVKGSAGKLLVGKKPPTSKEIKEAKEEVGGGTLVQGVCYGEEGGLIFVTDSAPGGSWKKVAATCAKQDAGLTLKIEFRQKGTGEEGGSESEGED